MVDIVVVRCYGDRLSLNVNFFNRNFSLRGNPEGGRESYNNSHMSKFSGKLKSVSACPRDKVDVFREGNRFVTLLW